MERTSRKIPVTERQFLWVQDDDKGEVTLHVGPTMVSPTAADRVVVDDGEGGFQEDTSGRPQRMIEVGDNQYAVLSNPLLENDGGPNGRFRPGRNESRPQKNGTRSMIPGPCSFYLRPGQRCDVRDAHELGSSQFLVVKVYGEVDKAAPYYDVTARSASITRATAQSVTETSKSIADFPLAELRRGQLVVIRGLDTQFYIPPSGVDIVPDTSVDASGAALTAAAARALLQQADGAAALAAGPARDDEAQAELASYDDSPDDGGYALRGTARMQVPGAIVNQSARVRHRKAAAPMPAPVVAQGVAPPPQAPASGAGFAQPAPAPREVAAEVLASPTVRRALEREARQARLIRNAVVLGEKEFCVIVDADGKREIRVGPARVFPGPYDTFQTLGSNNRVYDAYELLPQRALWLRVIAPLSKEEMARKLPRGFVLEKELYHPGDEILLTGVSTFFVPFNEIEVLSPSTGQAVVGNDHSRVFIEALGIDQKSGIYVRDLATGEVRLVRGKQSYLVDPRREVQITRTVPPDDWNLWVAAQEPHKATERPVTTPWALSIIVPNNSAVLVTSANARRVVEGPCVTLLGYEETLTPLTLSTGTPKTDAHPLRTCFLRVVGNRVSDVITVETVDFVRIAIRVSYSVHFVAEHKETWFNHENYVQVMCDHLRSIVRGRCRTTSLSALWPQVHAVVRDTILGERQAQGGRAGRFFGENGLMVSEVEVLSATIEVKEVADLMERVQTQSVTLQIGDRQAQEQLVSAKLRAQVEAERQALTEDGKQREARLAALVHRLAHEQKLVEVQAFERLQREQQALSDERAKAGLGAKIERDAATQEAHDKLVRAGAESRAAADRLLAAAELERLAALRAEEIRLIEAQAAATVAEREAVQAGLVEAMTALGDKLMLGEVASNMNLVSLFKGKDVGTLLADVLGGTRVVPTLQALRDKYRTPPPTSGGGGGGGDGATG